MEGESSHAASRNRVPCLACKLAKRKCNRTTSRCSRCVKRDVPCVPSMSARWRVHTAESNGLVKTQETPRVRKRPSSPVRPATPIIEENPAILSNSDDTIPDPAPDVEWWLNDFGLQGDEMDSILSNGGGNGGNSLLDSTMWHSPSSQDIRQFAAFTPPPELLVGLEHLQGNELSNVPHFGATKASPEALTIQSPIILKLWHSFLCIIDMTMGGNQPTNPAMKYLASTALKRRPLFSAAILLSLSLQSNLGSTMVSGLELTEVPERFAVAHEMEQEVVDYVESAGLSEGGNEQQSPIALLSTLVTLCSAYIAQGNLEKVTIQLEHAFLVLRQGFAIGFASDQTFLFFARWMGFIHTMALLSEVQYDVSAPDYLTIYPEDTSVSPAQPDSPEDNSTAPHPASTTTSIEASPSFFEDIDSFLGLSNRVAALLYRLGRILRSRRASYQNAEQNHWVWKDFEADSDDVEIRIQQFLAELSAYRKTHELSSPHDLYNAALLYSAQLLFLCCIKDVHQDSSQVSEIVAQILDFCAGVPADSLVGKFLVFCLYMAGSRTTRPMQREFVRNRLKSLMADYCITDVKQTLELLEDQWRCSTFPNQVTRKASVCALI